MNDDLTSDDKRAVDELVADVRDSLENNYRGVQMLHDGLDKDDDPEGEGIDPVRDPVQLDRLTRLRHVLQTALADLP